MNKNQSISLLFYVAAVYDGFLGGFFLVSGDFVFDLFDVPPPNHLGYIQFPAALLIVFALMFLAVALKPEQNRHLIPFGILLKVSYCGVVFSHWFTAGVPGMWKPFAIFDLVFLAAFTWAFKALESRTTTADALP